MSVDGMYPCLNAMIWLTGAPLRGVLAGWVRAEWGKSVDRRMSGPATGNGGSAVGEGHRSRAQRHP